jgi:hypothetical protein
MGRSVMIEQFQSRESIGVVESAREMERVDSGDIEVYRTTAYELVDAFLRLVGIR